MRRAALSILLVAAVVGMASTAGAYDYLYTNDPAMTHDAGTFGIKANVMFMMSDSWYDHDGNSMTYDEFAEALGETLKNAKMSGMWFPIDLFYSVTDQMEIGVQPKFLMDKMTADDMDDYEATGLGDTWVDVKYMATMEPMMAVRAGVKVPTGDDEGDKDNGPTGEGQMDVDAAVMIGMPAGPGTFDLAAGYRLRMENTDAKWKPGNEIHFAACYTYFIGEMMNLRIGADGFFGSDYEDDGKLVDDSGSNVVYITPGFEYMMDNGMSVGVDMHYPLMGTNIDALWGFGAYVSFGS